MSDEIRNEIPKNTHVRTGEETKSPFPLTLGEEECRGGLRVDDDAVCERMVAINKMVQHQMQNPGTAKPGSTFRPAD